MPNRKLNKATDQRDAMLRNMVTAFLWYTGTIEEAKENWITLKEKNGTSHLINLDYVYDVKEVKKKQK